MWYKSQLIFKLFTVIPLLVLVWYSTSLCANSHPFLLATVNGTNIYSYDITTRKKIMSLLDPNFRASSQDYQTSLINQLIEEALLLDEVKKYKFTVSKDEVEQHIHYIESLNKWEKGEVYNRIVKQNLTEKDIYNYFYTQLLVQNFVQSYAYSRTQISSSEFNKAYYNLLNLNGKTQYLLSEIFISTHDKSVVTAQQQINNIYSNLQKGANFDLLVTSYTENLYAKSQNGLVGWVYETQLSDQEKSVLEGLSINDYTPPIHRDNGFYIFKLLDKQPIIFIDTTDTETTTKLKELLKEKLINDKSQEIMRNYINELKNQAIITYYYSHGQ